MTEQLTADIKNFRVSKTNALTSSGEKEVCNVEAINGMDFERCSALHNAIVRHGWTARGHDLSELPDRTYLERWKACMTPHQSESLQDRLHPSVLEFLQRVIEPPDFYPGSYRAPVFFYHLAGLNAPLDLFANHEDEEEEVCDRYVTLYSFQGSMVDGSEIPDGLVYDQLRHECALIKSVGEGSTFILEEQDLPWQPLETALSIYCEMIESGKVVALPRTVKGPEPFEYVRDPVGGYALRKIPDEELRDPRTGARRTRKTFDPWVMVPFTSKGVERALQAWERLVEVVEARLRGRKGAKRARREKMYSPKTLEQAGLRRERFAFSFLRQARRPTFANVAPGLRVLTEEEFVKQQSNIQSTSPPNQQAASTSPILLLTSTQPHNTQTCANASPDELRLGLYLEPCDPNDDAFPYEDAVKIRTSSSRDPCYTAALLKPDETSLLSPDSGHVQLHVILERFVGRIESGEWIVGSDGVEGDGMEIDGDGSG